MSGNWNATAIKKNSLAIQAADVLRKKIIIGELVPGEHLVEDSLSEFFGISKVSIREAVSILISEGLLEKEKNKYTRVALISRDDVREMFEVRAAMEQLAVERCIKDGTVPYQQLIRQTEIINNLVGTDQQAVSNEAFIEEDMKFHRLIVEASGNRRALETWRRIESQMKILFYSQIRRFPLSISNVPELSHENIAEVMRSGDAELARELIHRHLYGAYDVRLNDPILIKHDKETER